MDGMKSSERHLVPGLAQDPRQAMQGRAGGTLSLRLAVPGDAATIARIYNESLPEAGTLGRRPAAPLATDLVPLSEDRLLGWLVQHRQVRRPLWVACAGHEVVGWLSLLGFSDRPGCGGTAEIAVYIARAWHRRGVGRYLLRRALREAPLWGLDRLIAVIWHENVASQSLFRGHGFSPWGALPGVVRVGEQRLNMLIFGYELSPSKRKPAQ
jgi:L-amino acid N-acyltransferase YncA